LTKESQKQLENERINFVRFRSTIDGIKETDGVRKMKKKNHSIPLKYELRKI
jgi:hypothetical protein